MKKNTVLFVGLMLSINPLFSQKELIKIKESKIENHLFCDYHETINHDTQDTLYAVSIGFQNKEYSSIIDVGVIYFGRQSELNIFIKDLNLAKDKMSVSQINMEWERKEYVLHLHDFSNDLYLSTPEKIGAKYTTINAETLDKLVEWLSDITIGKLIEYSPEELSQKTKLDSLKTNGLKIYKDGNKLDDESMELSGKESKEKIKMANQKYREAQKYLEEYRKTDKSDSEVYMALYRIYSKTNQQGLLQLDKKR